MTADGSMTSPSFNIEVTQTVQPEGRETIVRGLIEFNARHAGEPANLDVYVRDPSGRIVGGLIGEFRWGWFSIHALWVAEELRGSGIGTRVLTAAELAAIQNGCHEAILDAFSFQAPAFYEKRGYVRVGVVDGYWGGAQRIILQKRLRPDSPAVAGG
jgi:GNAT superfamily N-acetyltransferase